MYNPPAFREDDLVRQHQFIRANPLGLLISAPAGEPQASPLPFHVEDSRAAPGVLSGHLSRANDHWRTLQGSTVLVVFQAADAYVSPSWYASKAEHGKVVPTWNYVMVQVRGVARVIDEPEWLRQQITKLTDEHEGSRAVPWHVTDAPHDFIEAQIRGIVGLEIEIRQIEGKWKASQNRSIEDRNGVVAGLGEAGQDAMATLVRNRMPR